MYRAGPSTPGGQPTWSPANGPEVWVFLPGEDLGAVALARHVAREAARAWGCADAAHTAMTVVGELAGNALFHIGGPAPQSSVRVVM